MYIKVKSDGYIESVSFVPQTEEWIETEDKSVDEIGRPERWMWDGEKMVLDEDYEAKKMAMDIKNTLISSLKKSLTDSDYKIMKFAESLLEVNSLADFLGLILRTRQELREIVRQRAEWRKQINEFEEDEDV